MGRPVQKLNAQQLRINLDLHMSMSQIARFHTGDDGYITVAKLLPDDVFLQWHYLYDELPKALSEIQESPGVNWYYSVNSFFKPERQVENVRRINGLYVDIDCHKSRHVLNPMELYDQLRAALFDVTLPRPSVSVFTGRGLQLHWQIEHAPKQALPLWQMIIGALNTRLHGYISSLDKGYTVDNCTDVTRVLRLAGTYNSKAGSVAKVIEECPVVYRLDLLRHEWFAELEIITRKRVSRSSTPSETRILHLYTAYSLFLARLDDISTLRDLRASMSLPEDCRRRMVFLYRYWSCCALGDERDALDAALRFNQGFMEPLRESIVIRETRSAEKAYREWFADPTKKKGYNYRNATLIRLLEITEDEQKHFKTIIGQPEKNSRAKEKNWYHDKRDRQRADARENKAARAIFLLKMGLSNRAIMQETGMSLAKVKEIAKTSGVKRKPGPKSKNAGCK